MKEGNEMTKIDIISGFLGAGKTTLIQKLIKEVYAGKKVVLVENEFGEIGIDGGFLKDAGIVVNEINSGCICCTLQGDFRNALQEVVKKYDPDHIIIEPSGVGKLSDILAVVKDVEGLELNSYSTVVDAKRCETYHKNFKEFFDDQITTAACIILSRTQLVDEETLQKDIAIIRELNNDARIITTPWDDLSGQAIIEAMEGSTDGFHCFDDGLTREVKPSSKQWKVLQMASQNSKRKKAVDAVDVVVTMTMMTIVAVAMTIMNMNTIITTMRKKNAAVAVVLPNMKSTTMNIMMMKNVAAITTTRKKNTMRKNAAVVAMIITIMNITIITIMDMMQMKYSHQSVLKQLINTL